ncbi:MAG: hypothetical protein IPL08_13150 [Saprospiraceae bacterium]|nr:hypothetical protein [Saprospiraceae bacterium]
MTGMDAYGQDGTYSHLAYLRGAFVIEERDGPGLATTRQIYTHRYGVWHAIPGYDE